MKMEYQKRQKVDLKLLEKIVDKAISYGIKKEDIFIDCLSLTVSAQQEEAMETIECIKMVKEKLGVKTILGVSNVSFGVPNRKALNSTYLNYGISTWTRFTNNKSK